VLDLKLIRQETDAVRAALARRGPDAVAGLDRVIALDERRRAAIPELEELRARRNAAAEAIAQAKRGGGDAAEAIAEQRELGAREKQLAQQLAAVEEELNAALAPLPNLPDPTAAAGPEDELVRVVGEPPALSFQARDHLELAGAMIDMDRAANLSGSRFAYLKGDLVMLELALVRWALGKLRGHGFEPVIPPVLVRERALYGTGFLPDTEQQIYSLPADELYLVGTSEVALASLHDGEILDAQELPLRYAGFSPCFRREAGAAGRDTRGIFRVHQFDKVEMFSFVEPARSTAEHERILAIEEEVLQELGLPYRVVNIAVGDLGNSAAKKYDCEAWLPSQGRYRELTSCSNTTDYQARRLGIRVRREQGGRGAEMLHTLNGTAVAVGRTLIALLENGQREDGSVALPACLREFGAPAELCGAAPPASEARAK
jgi:seryl-tRNA synthetase